MLKRCKAKIWTIDIMIRTTIKFTSAVICVNYILLVLFTVVTTIYHTVIFPPNRDGLRVTGRFQNYDFFGKSNSMRSIPSTPLTKLCDVKKHEIMRKYGITLICLFSLSVSSSVWKSFSNNYKKM